MVVVGAKPDTRRLVADNFAMFAGVDINTFYSFFKNILHIYCLFASIILLQDQPLE